MRKLDAPLMGVREWNVGTDGRLLSTGYTYTWNPGVQQAECKDILSVSMPSYPWDDLYESSHRHRAPHRGCGCGLYAFYTYDSMIKHGDNVTHKSNGISGVVSAWGKVIRSEYGFRAEYMKVEAFILEYPKRSYWGTSVDFTEAHESLAKKHGVPLIKSFEVSAFMGLSGGSVMECEELPSMLPVDSYDLKTRAYNSRPLPYPYPGTFNFQVSTPPRYVVAYHYDYRGDGFRNSWVEYSDGSTAPMTPAEKDALYGSDITAPRSQTKTNYGFDWNKLQMKGGQNG